MFSGFDIVLCYGLSHHTSLLKDAGDPSQLFVRSCYAY